jgi:hypothetical protein
MKTKHPTIVQLPVEEFMKFLKEFAPELSDNSEFRYVAVEPNGMIAVGVLSESLKKKYLKKVGQGYVEHS